MIVELDHRLFLEQDYALINPMQVGKEAYSDLDVLRLQPKGLERHERLVPLLVHLGGMEEARRINLLERVDNWTRGHDMPLFSALLRSETAPGQVKASLQARMVLKRKVGGQAWLRYHDPRVFRHLCWLLDDAQLATLMGPVTAWLGYDPLSGSWCRWARPDALAHPRLHLSPGQWQAVEQFEALNRCLRNFTGEGKPSDDATARSVLEGLLAAREQGLTQSDDVILYARQQFDHGKGISVLPAVADRLRQVRDGVASYIMACGDLLEEDFRRRPGVM